MGKKKSKQLSIYHKILLLSLAKHFQPSFSLFIGWRDIIIENLTAGVELGGLWCI